MAGVSVEWLSSNGIIAQVSEDGLVTSGESGTAAVQASVGTWTAEVSILVEPGPRAYLHTLYRATGGDDWNDNSNWRTDAPLDDWYGVTTDAQGNITRLDLSGNRLTGSIPGALGSLQNLRHLYLDENQLTGSIPIELGNLQNLQVLSLAENELTDSIPRSLGRLGELVSMNLNENDLTGSVPRALIGLHSLRELRINDNPLGEPLTRYLLALRLKVFHCNNTDLCAPADESFQKWLGSIDDNRPNRHCD